ncbi:hemolysin secretion/activation protein [Photorhabdus asymbiotica]|uniref:hemolysin secretion/activation protein n=1 Tax=Photorhabdus asymbiotica TaxID=291112 RepID=UPI003DA708AC
MKSSILVLAIFCRLASGSQAADLSDQQRIHQQARQQAREAQLAPSPEAVRLFVPEKTVSAAFPTVAHGFPLARVTLTGSRHSVLAVFIQNNPAARV